MRRILGLGLSPFKSEHTPSFSVRRETNSFYCFASGIGGNVLTFTRYYYKCGYKEAIEHLKEYAGVKGEVLPRKKLAIVEVAKRFSPPRKTKKEAKPTVLPDDYMVRYEKNDEKLAEWEREGISRDSLDRFQVFYDSFSDRLVYPIRDPQGRIVNIGGRTLDPEWKEKKLRKYTYFFGWPGGMNILYGLHENMDAIVRKKQIIVFEGAKSVLLADTYGINNAVALLTSHVNKQQLSILIRLGCEVVFALDKDVQIFDDHNVQKLKQYTNISYVNDTIGLLAEKDSPIDKGISVFKTLYEERRRLQ